MDYFCKSLGDPGVGFHTHVFGIAVADVLGTIVLSLIFGRWAGYNPIWVFIILLIIGTYMHINCRINTTLVNALGYKY